MAKMNVTDIMFTNGEMISLAGSQGEVKFQLMNADHQSGGFAAVRTRAMSGPEEGKFQTVLVRPEAVAMIGFTHEVEEVVPPHTFPQFGAPTYQDAISGAVTPGVL